MIFAMSLHQSSERTKPQNQSQQPLASSQMELHKSPHVHHPDGAGFQRCVRLKWVCAEPVNNRLSVLNVFPIAHI